MPKERSGRRGEWNEVVKAVVRRHRVGLYKDESELSITDHSLALTMKKLLLLYDEIIVFVRKDIPLHLL